MTRHIMSLSKARTGVDISKDAGDPYENLANAIIYSAVNEYKKDLKALQKCPNNKSVLYNKQNLERFFMSDWFCVLTNVKGVDIIERLNRQYV